jgi:Mlc titration factor MtfA (ptsG expression regulator)
MPNFALHELAHGYHDRELPGGFKNSEIAELYQKAVTSKSYEQVQRWNGKEFAKSPQRAYAMTNPMEYFAENTEAFFSKNDFFPFTREELLRHDPAMSSLLARLWGVQASVSR